MSITSEEWKVCQGCYGSGMQKGTDGISRICPVCGGTGKVREPGVYVTY